MRRQTYITDKKLFGGEEKLHLQNQHTVIRNADMNHIQSDNTHLSNQ